MLDRLIVMTGADSGREHHINMAEGPVVVGRSNAQATIVLPDLQASRVHFQIEDRDGAKWVVDQGSSSGTIVNGRKVSAHQLKAGDIIRAGEMQLRFVPAGQDAAPASAGASGEQRLEDLVGTTLAHFQIKKLIARGTSGCVFQALESDSGETVALKVLFPELSKNEEEMQRFVRAMKTIMPLRHPNLVTLSGAGRKGALCWVAMDYIEGESLGKLIERIGKEGKLPWKFSLRVAVHVARGTAVRRGK
ncbi:MAG: serine/threonine-protein kinase [Gemmatales bacterium]